ncbi:MAG: 3-dehydroquinate synthase [Saprospiraceae bacterium]|nr:3-dehydroquinate synthase [Saprospiraceae bacterium]
MAVLKTKSYHVYIDESLDLFYEKLELLEASSVFVLVDENTLQHCLPILADLDGKYKLFIIQITSGEENKTLDTCRYIWTRLSELGGDRKSVLINLGGGVIGDMGGFAASCYMRGIRFIQVPTSLLSQVDASVGSKLGVDFNGAKNMIGVFNDPEFVFIHSPFLKTLPNRQLRSGYAETIKHALIYDRHLWETLKPINELNKTDSWAENILKSVSIKNTIVNQDPYENSIRKILNFGHTIGHAIESSYLNRPAPLLHGEAIILGMLVESYISVKLNLLDPEAFNAIESFLKTEYSDLFQLAFNASEIFSYLKFDKKKFGESILFALIDSIGSTRYDIEIPDTLIREALNNTLRLS